MIVLIAAVAQNGVIGNKKQIPWHIPEDFKLFKEKTLHSVVIMGRTTFESIGRPLPQRENIVVSTTASEIDGAIVCRSLSEALEKAKEFEKDIFIIGGARLYKEGLQYADKLYISHVKKEVEGDTFFPEFDKTAWKITEKKDFDEFTFTVYEK